MSESSKEPDLLKYLLNISRQMVEMREPSMLLSFILDEALQLVGAERGYVVLVEEGGPLDFVVKRRRDGTDIERVDDQISHSVLNMVIEDDEPLVLTNAMTDPRFAGATSVLYLRLRSVMCVPLITKGSTIGAVYVENRSVSGRFHKKDLSPLQLFANQAVVAIENAHLYQKAQQEIMERRQAEAALRQSQEALEKAHDLLEIRVQERTVDLEREVEERKRAETDLKAYSARLEEALTQLHATQEKLVRQERLAVLGQLAGGVGHELRNPLSVIANAIYYLKATWRDVDANTREYLDIIDSRIREADKIISGLLNLSRTRPSAKEQASIVALLSDVLARHEAPANIEVTIDVPADIPTVYVDPGQIRQVLINLVTNAYQAIINGGQLLFTAEILPGYVVLFVADTGNGISPEQVEHIFEPLFTTKTKGIGLGLAVSKTLLEINDGDIAVTSEVGVGTTFQVKLPIYDNGAK